MSISAHLTPEPERRLWLIHESMGRSVERADWKIAALTAFAAAELAFIPPAAPAGAAGFFAVAALAAALPIGVFAFSPLTRLPKWLSFLDPPKDKPVVGDCLILAEDLARYTRDELIFRLDKYLGGGITATPYYEDIVIQIVDNAMIAVRKQRLLRVVCAVIGASQLGLLARLICR